MGKRIPQSIQEKVISRWLDGKSRDVVARELRISGGSVSSIIQSRRRKDRQFDLLRVVAVQLRQRGLTVEEFAPLIRCRESIKREYSESGKTIDEEEEEVESLMQALCVFVSTKKRLFLNLGTWFMASIGSQTNLELLCPIWLHM
jgi:intergrase/recombinase